MDTVAGNGVLQNTLRSEPYQGVVTIGLIFKFFNIKHIIVTVRNLEKRYGSLSLRLFECFV